MDAVDPEQVYQELRTRLLGRSISDRQLAANSVSFWIDKVPGGGDVGCTIWLEPSWRIVGPERLLAGSMQAQDEDDPSGFEAVASVLDNLVGRTIDRLDIEPAGGDLVLEVSGGIIVRTFSSDPRETFHWRIKDYDAGQVLTGSPNGLRVKSAT